MKFKVVWRCTFFWTCTWSLTNQTTTTISIIKQSSSMSKVFKHCKCKYNNQTNGKFEKGQIGYDWK